jgi:hypothetical protein
MRQWAALLATGLSAAALAVDSASVRAEPADRGERFVLDMRACAAVSAEAVRRILVVEIGDLLVGGDESAPSGSDRLTLRCAGNLVWVEAAGDDGAHSVERPLRLSDFPGDAAPRALALAGLELLAARSPALRARIEARQAPTPAPKPALASTPAVVRAPAAAAAGTPAPPRLYFGVGGSWRRFLVDQGVSAWGGQAQVLRRLGRLLDLGADVEASGGTTPVRLGDANSLLLSAGGTLGVCGGGPAAGVALDLGGRVGLARLAGSAANPTSVTGAAVWHPWGGPLARARGYVGFGPLALTLSIEAGRSLSTVRGLAEGATVLSVSGFWTAISFGGVLRR